MCRGLIGTSFNLIFMGPPFIVFSLVPSSNTDAYRRISVSTPILGSVDILFREDSVGDDFANKFGADDSDNDSVADDFANNSGADDSGNDFGADGSGIAFATHAPFGKSSGITSSLCSVLHESRISSCKAGVTNANTSVFWPW